MKTPIAVLTFVAATVASATAQQSPNPQPPQTQSQPGPCAAAVKPPRFHFKIPPRFQGTVAKAEARIENNTGIQVDANQILAEVTAPKPCQPAPQAPPPSQKPQ